MVLPGHLAGGYLATTILLSISNAGFSVTQMTILFIVGILSGEGPDVDLIRYYFENRRKPELKEKHTADNHREYATHAPLVWLIGCLLVVAIGFLIGSKFISLVGWVVLAGSWSHFLFDSIEYGIRWLWPFTNKRFCLLEISETDPEGQKGTFAFYWKLIKTSYLKTFTFYAEILVVIAAAVVFFR